MNEKQSYLDRPWLRHLEERGIPTTMEPYPEIPLTSFLDNAVREFPNRPALTFMKKQMTYAEVGSEVDKLASALAELGVKKGDRVGTILVNSPQFIIADYAIMKAGAANVPCSPVHSARDLEFELGSAGVETLFCMDESMEKVKKVRGTTELKNVIATSLDDYVKPEPAAAPEGARSFRELVSRSSGRPPEVSINPEEDLCMVPFTGGATGVPKGVMLTHHNLVSNVIQTWGMIEQNESARFLLKGNCAIILGLPFFHSYGHWAMHSSIFLAWNMLLSPDPRDTDAIVELMRVHRPLFNVGVPTQYMKMTSKKTGRTGVIGFSGSAALPDEVAEKYETDAGAPVQEGYGLTETSPCTHANLTGLVRLLPEREGGGLTIPGFMKPILRSIVNAIGAPRIVRGGTYLFPLLLKAANKREKKTGQSVKKKASIGMPIVDTDCKLVDAAGAEVPFGEHGEMWIRGPQVMKGYWPEHGAGLVDGWLPTGDIARMDEDGFFYIVDRVKDMINISGNKVYSRVVDDVLFQHPGVEMAAAIGVPDPDRPGSERVKAFISVAPGHDKDKVKDEVMKMCKEQLPPYAVPKFIELRDEFPLTVTEKIFKRKLREEEIERMKEQGMIQG